MVTAEAVGEKSELGGGGGKSEGVTVPPVDLLTEVDEIVHSKHSFCRKCPLKKLKKKKCCGTRPISTTISGVSLRKKKLEKYAGILGKES